MGKPLLLYGLGNLLNWSFEPPDVAGTVPDDWDISLSVGGLNVVVNDEYHDPGEGLRSVQSLRQNVTSASTSSKAISAQRVALGDLLRITRETEGEIACCAMVKYGAPEAQLSAYLDMKQYQGTNLTVGEGTEKTPPSQRIITLGEGPEWLMLVNAQQVHADTTHVEVHLRYQLQSTGDYGIANYAWWDRVFVGGLVDFPKGVRDFGLTPDGGYAINEGDGVAEIVKLTSPRTQIDFTLRNLLEGSAFDLSVKRFLKLMGGSDPGMSAFWGDRDRFTNGERHFQRMILEQKRPKITYPHGVTRRIYKFRLSAFAEYSD